MRRDWRICTAESCTGGALAAALTSVPGSSAWFECGFVTYSNSAKTAMIDVPGAMLARHGAVSPQVADAMARGARRRAGADMSLAITGIAGPDGGSAAKPVGMVIFALCDGAGAQVQEQLFDGDRDAVRRASVGHALRMAVARLQH